MVAETYSKERLIHYAATVLADIAFDGITNFEPGDYTALNKSMQTPDGSWGNAALCTKEPNIGFFYFEKGPATSYNEARKVCGQCTVRAQCMLDTLAGRDRELETMRAGLPPKVFRTMRYALGLGVGTPITESVMAINRRVLEISATPEP